MLAEFAMEPTTRVEVAVTMCHIRRKSMIRVVFVEETTEVVQGVTESQTQVSSMIIVGSATAPTAHVLVAMASLVVSHHDTTFAMSATART